MKKVLRSVLALAIAVCAITAVGCDNGDKDVKLSGDKAHPRHTTGMEGNVADM